MKRLFLLAGAMLLSIAAIQPAAAQTALNYNWGAAHVEPNQVISINLRMDKAAVVTTLPVLLTLEDKHGNILYQTWTTVTNGQTVVWTAGAGLVGFGGGGAGPAGFDFYMDNPIIVPVSLNVHTLVPSIRVNVPSVPSAAATWVDMLTPTLEVVDMSPAYHVASFANNPHLTVYAPRQ
jgi:hypothetical protein